MAFVVVLVLWEVLVALLDIQSFILPRPTEIVASFVDKSTVIWNAGLNTLEEALGGFVIGVSLGVVAALAAARWASVREGLLPIATAASAMPIVALAPIMNQWFASTSPVSKMMVVSVLVFFPVLVNTARGLTEVDAGELELMRSLASTPRDVLIAIRIPSALPYFFNALKVATALSLIGAIVAEYFGGRQDVLGQYIINRANLFQFPDAWAAILVASMLGIGFYLTILGIERVVMPWHASFRQAESG